MSQTSFCHIISSKYREKSDPKLSNSSRGQQQKHFIKKHQMNHWTLCGLLVCFVSGEQAPPRYTRTSTVTPPYYNYGDDNHYEPIYSGGGWAIPTTTTTTTEQNEAFRPVNTVPGNSKQHPAVFDSQTSKWICPAQRDDEVMMDHDGHPLARSVMMEPSSSGQSMPMRTMFSLSKARVLDNYANDTNVEFLLKQLTGINLTPPPPKTANRVQVNNMGVSVIGVMRGQPKTITTNYVDGNVRSGTMKIMKGIREAPMASPAFCVPENTTVSLPVSSDPNVFTYPTCTRIERCGGCCSHDLLSCQPTETEVVKLTVLRTTYQESRLMTSGNMEVEVLRHKACRCACRIKPEDCNVMQKYMVNECRCVCRDALARILCNSKRHSKYWDPLECRCKCKHELACSTGLLFDTETCSCSKQEHTIRQPLIKGRYL